MTGNMEDLNGGSCSTNSDTDMPSGDCIFVADGPSSLQSSVMAIPYLPGNDQWCDITEERLHNDDNPSKHNTMCNGKSVFEIVRQSPDFSGYQPRNQTNEAPSFTILQPKSLTEPFVFVLDWSGSMNSNNRKERLKQGVNRFMMIDVDLEQNLPIGITSFSLESFIDYPITIVNDTKTRDGIINTVDHGINHDGGTCIHKGVRTSLEALRDYNWNTGGLVILLTDGGQSCSGAGGDGVIDWLGEINDEVMSQNTRFCTIAFSNNADKDLEELAFRYLNLTNSDSPFHTYHTFPIVHNNAGLEGHHHLCQITQDQTI